MTSGGDLFDEHYRTGAQSIYMYFVLVSAVLVKVHYRLPLQSIFICMMTFSIYFCNG